MTFELAPFLDSLIIVLLVATIVYASILNRRLTRFRDNRVELERATRSFAEAALRADGGIKALRAVADETGRVLNDKLTRAQELRDDLAELVNSAERLASRLDGGYEREAAKPARAAGRTVPLRPISPVDDAVEADGQPLAAMPGDRTDRPTRRTRGEPDRDLLKAIEEMR
ncbi:MAG: hypothetical protein H6842_13775 [Rhodospirillaceae bacterium]|nr:hypothetical protein [Rhodospirillaceae bacterium]